MSAGRARGRPGDGCSSGAGVIGLGGHPAWVVAALLAVAAASAWRELLWAVPEEFLFRGLIQGELARRFGGHAVPVIVAAALFALAHLLAGHGLTGLATFAPALLFGALRAYSDSIWPAVAAHAVANTVVP